VFDDGEEMEVVVEVGSESAEDVEATRVEGWWEAWGERKID
jgi:hypothetical protein